MRICIESITIGLLAAATLAPAVAADQVTVVSSRDNTLYESVSRNVSNGAGQHFFAGRTNIGAIRRGVVMFDLADAVPPGSTINSVSLTLFMSMTASPELPISLHRALKDWGEGTSDADGGEGMGAPVTPDDVTWEHTFWDTDFWQNLGGDFIAAPTSSILVWGPDFYTWPSSPEMVADVQGWVDDPAASFGWLLMGDESQSPSTKRFDTHENPNIDRRPMLTIDFTPGAGTDLMGFEVVFGSHLGGSLNDMKSSDDAWVTTRSKRGFTAFEPNLMQMEVDAATTNLTGEELSVTIESRENNPGGIAKIRFRNWNTGAFTQIATYKLGPTDETVTIGNIDPSLYVDGNGDIDLSVKHVVIAVFSAIGFDSWFDLIEISVE